mgnify:CR=1 FL=1
MTMNQEDTFKLDDVPIPKLPERENLEKEIIETIQTMPQGKSFFVPIDSKKKQKKKALAIRAAARRHAEKYPIKNFRVLMWKESVSVEGFPQNKKTVEGLRVFRDEDHQSIPIT